MRAKAFLKFLLLSSAMLLMPKKDNNNKNNSQYGKKANILHVSTVKILLCRNAYAVVVCPHYKHCNIPFVALSPFTLIHRSLHSFAEYSIHVPISMIYT